MPSTRVGGLTNTASRKLLRSIASAFSFSFSSARPCFQVIISVNTAPPIASGNQPPCSSLSRLEAKKVRSTTKNQPVAAMHSASG